MAERWEEPQICKALDSLAWTANRAWRQRTCLPVARFWKVALAMGVYEANEHDHLAKCASCRQRAQEVEGAAASGTARPEANRIVVAEQLINLADEPPKNAARAARSTRHLTFSADPHLTARIVQDKAGVRYLELEHRTWMPANLIRLKLAAKEATSPWTWLAPLRTEAGGVSARVLLDDKAVLRARNGFLYVQPVRTVELTDDDVKLLGAAMAAASQDAAILAAWREWGKAVLETNSVVESVHPAVAGSVRQIIFGAGACGNV